MGDHRVSLLKPNAERKTHWRFPVEPSQAEVSAVHRARAVNQIQFILELMTFAYHSDMMTLHDHSLNGRDSVNGDLQFLWE